MEVFPDSLWDKDDIVSSYMRLDQQGLCPEDFFRRNDRFGMKYSIEGIPFCIKSFDELFNEYSFKI